MRRLPGPKSVEEGEGDLGCEESRHNMEHGAARKAVRYRTNHLSSSGNEGK